MSAPARIVEAVEREHRSADGDPSTDAAQPDWYKDAVIYQLHVKAFQDSNNDGIGDFRGLTQRLDYIADLGVDTVWLLPFYPSPLRDDGYDISDYRAIHPAYGTMDDFRTFLDAAHGRGMRVITELVINHTSDQHPWFQRARQAPPGSPERDFFVWSDTDEKYAGTRIIFLDTEKSNWTWDAEAGAFYWHRFYSHQPDLNFDNPAVLREVIDIMHFWLDMGVDGLRLDAIPYLIEREGTNNENLPETHEVLKTIRAELDAHYPDRMLLAEANQWPEDTRPYFGEGDECHMAFHFPLMPRMYMALAQEDRHPVTDILRQTPDIPDNCQWAIFLRNHDELTLEMVTDRERDYMWSFYAADSRARINLGIRRRLAPLLESDRRKIELMNGLLISMPGTPVVYYGDEIGMGDNYYLGDRDGVRTAMQWSADRNAGFSRANPQQLYLPIIQDPVYGYEAVNVEAQSASPSSLLNWMKRLIRIRKREKALARGDIEPLYPQNRKILAYTRMHEDETILCVFNVSRTAQAVELDLHHYRGLIPVELDGGTPFPPIGDLPYLLTLPPYGFFLFKLASEAALPDWHEPVAEIQPEFVTLACRSTDCFELLTPDTLGRLDRHVLPEFLPLQRWYGGKGEKIRRVATEPGPRLGEAFALTVTEVETSESGSQHYFLPLVALWGEENIQFGAPTLSATLARLRRINRIGALVDASAIAGFASDMVRAMQQDAEFASGTLAFAATGAAALHELPADLEPHPVGGEQSNVSMVLGDSAILKIYRRLRPGRQPDIEVGRFLSEQAGFDNTPTFLGEATLTRADEEPTTVAACFSFVRNQGDAWTVLLDAISREIDDRAMIVSAPETDMPEEPFDTTFPANLGRVIGQRTGELHRALAIPTDDPAFGTEPIGQADIEGWVDDTRREAELAFDGLQKLQSTPETEALAVRRAELDASLAELARIAPGGRKSRIHGDYHLGQVLVAHTDVYIVDFEGEPRHRLEQRRARTSPLRDVAGMVRSFDYAAFTAVRQRRAQGLNTETVASLAQQWREAATRSFLDAYWEASGTSPSDRDRALLRLFLLQKALYEIGYEAENRPGWVSIPVAGVLALLDGIET
ncbi:MULTISPECIES: maltose alpha-D-glucosyltransferase [unclassified Roseitalea]|uniref:maltose alpha-D-glucosyltransferase n=1 Tax=unclassified Roseitalea TaxID=2639107 RepID=UPI00273FD136|nr:MULTISPECIES: maltose alpha-D-glucosyltransferase [unclassified Roseitalea]